MEKEHEEKRRRFFPTVSLGSVLASLTFAGAGIGLYTQVIADVSNHKVEIANLKENAKKQEEADKTSRQEIKQDFRDVKSEVRDVNQKIDKLILELRESNRRR